MKASETPTPDAADRAEIDAFCDTLWLEDGLAKALLASYRSDLLRLAGWLAEQRLGTLCEADDVALTRFVATLSQTLRASSQARYISTLRRFYRHLLARGRIAADPTLVSRIGLAEQQLAAGDVYDAEDLLVE